MTDEQSPGSMMAKQRFVLNPYMDVVLDTRGRTIILVGGKEFIQCKRLVLNIPIKNVEDYREIDSIDELVDYNAKFWNQKRYKELSNHVSITPEEEYFGHASNLQAWVEHDYDTRLLHSNLSIPLLWALAREGDEKARRVLLPGIESRLQSCSCESLTAMLETLISMFAEASEGGISKKGHVELLYRLLQEMLEKSDGLRIDCRNFKWENVGIALLNTGHEDEAITFLLDITGEVPDSERPYLLGCLETLARAYKAKNDVKGLAWTLRDIVKQKEIMGISATMDYHGIPLVPVERAAMVELETLAGAAIPKVNEIDWDTFGFVSDSGYVTGLGLYQKGLTYLPESIGDLTAMEDLRLSENHLSSLPDSIGNLTCLEILHLYGNTLSSLPDTIGNLKLLVHLILGSNQLHALPDSLGNLDKLLMLHLVGNPLHDVPACIGNLVSLRILYLGSANLETMPDNIGRLTALEELFLEDNHLSSLPGTMGNLVALRSLRLNSNQFSSFPAAITKLPRLEFLYLVHNRLDSIPDSIENMKGLRTLNLSLNNLKTLPDSLRHLASLKALSLDRNHLTSLPIGWFEPLKQRGCKIGCGNQSKTE